MAENRIEFSDFIDPKLISELEKLDKKLSDLDKTLTHIKDNQGGFVDPKGFSEYQKELAKLNEKIKEAEGLEKERLRIELQRVQVMTKIEAAEKGYTKELELEKQKLSELNKQIKEEIKARDFANDSIKAYRERNKLLRQEMDKLSTSTKEGREQMAKYRAEIDKNTKIINENTDADRKRISVIGQYKDQVIDAAKAMLSPAGIIAAVGLLAKMFYDLAKGVTEARRQVSQLTNLSGKELNDFTSQVKATANVFDVDFNEVLIAANSLSKQMGISLPEAIAKINKGFADGANSSGQFLDMLKEYAPQFKAAGLSADQAIQLMSQSVKEGIYSDKGADVIKEATLRLREMPKATQDALKGIGLDSVEIQNQLKAGTITIFEAIQMVSKRLSILPPQASSVGTAIADIFGGPGEDAGLEYIKLLGRVKKGLEDIPLNEFGQQQLKNVEATEKLNKAVDKWLGDGTTKWDSFVITLKNVAAEIIGNERVMRSLGDVILTTLLGPIYPLKRGYDDLKTKLQEWGWIKKEEIKVTKELTEAEKKQYEENTAFYKDYKKQEKEKVEATYLSFEQIQALSDKNVKKSKEDTKKKEQAEKDSLNELKKAYDEYIEYIGKKREQDVISTIESIGTKQKNLEKDAEDSINLLQKDVEKRSELRKQDEIEEKEKQLKDSETRKEIFNQSVELANSLFELGASRREQELTDTENKRQYELELAGDNEKKKAEINKKYDREAAKIKTEQAKADRNQALFNIAIQTGVNIVKAFPNPVLMALAGGLGLAQGIAVAAKKIPKFKKGVIDFKGEGTETSDSNIVAISKGESVIKAASTKKAKNLLSAINSDGSKEQLIKAFLTDVGGLGGTIENQKINYNEKFDKLIKQNEKLISVLSSKNSDNFDSWKVGKMIEKNQQRIIERNKYLK